MWERGSSTKMTKCLDGVEEFALRRRRWRRFDIRCGTQLPTRPTCSPLWKCPFLPIH
jgi:hypothetical protein